MVAVVAVLMKNANVRNANMKEIHIWCGLTGVLYLNSAIGQAIGQALPTTIVTANDSNKG